MSFGKLFRKARKDAGFSTIRSLADYLSSLGLTYTDEAIGHWENNRRVPPRAVLLQVLGVFAAQGGITELSQINAFMWALDWRDVDSEEQQAYFPNLSPLYSIDSLPPKPYVELVGRENEVETLLAHLTHPNAYPVVALSGLGGIGKTAIAYEVATQAISAGHFENLAWEGTRSEEFSGISIRTRKPQVINEHLLLDSIARHLGFDALANAGPRRLPESLRAVIRTGNYLIVLDNLETLKATRDVAKLLYSLVSPPGSNRPSKVLITSRERLVEEDYVFDYFVRGLSKPAAIDLLKLEAHNRNIGELDLDDYIIDRIFAVTGGMPLALKLIVSQYHLSIPLERELDRLEQATDEEQLYRFIYFSLWEKLSVPAQQVLVGAATFGTSAMRSMLRRVSQVQESEFEQAAAELIRLSLMEVLMLPNQQRYDIHPMTRWFVNAPLTELWNQQRGWS